MKVLCTLLAVLLVSCTIIQHVQSQFMGMNPQMMWLMSTMTGSDRMRNMALMNMLMNGQFGGGGGGGPGMGGPPGMGGMGFMNPLTMMLFAGM